MLLFKTHVFNPYHVRRNIVFYIRTFAPLDKCFGVHFEFHIICCVYNFLYDFYCFLLALLYHLRNLLCDGFCVVLPGLLILLSFIIFFNSKLNINVDSGFSCLRTFIISNLTHALLLVFF